MTIVIYGVPGSPYVRMPILACEEKGVPWRLARLGMGETFRTDDPFLLDNGVAAILFVWPSASRALATADSYQGR